MSEINKYQKRIQKIRKQIEYRINNKVDLRIILEDAIKELEEIQDN